MHILKALSVGLVALSTAFTPVAFAHNGDNNENKSNNGHLTAEVKSSPIMVEIGPAGNVHVQGATVTSVSSSTISAATVWGSTTLSWNVVTNSSTQFNGKNGNVSLSDVKLGDSVNFNGKLDSSASALTVTATNVRDISVAKEIKVLLKDIFQGTLQSFAATTSPTSFTMKSGDKTLSVNVSASTQILNRNFGVTTLGTFQSGDTVRVYGSLQDATSSTINALIVRDATR